MTRDSVQDERVWRAAPQKLGDFDIHSIEVSSRNAKAEAAMGARFGYSSKIKKIPDIRGVQKKGLFVVYQK